MERSSHLIKLRTFLTRWTFRVKPWDTRWETRAFKVRAPKHHSRKWKQVLLSPTFERCQSEMFTEISLSIWNVKHQHFCVATFCRAISWYVYTMGTVSQRYINIYNGYLSPGPKFQGLCFSTPKGHHGMTIDGLFFSANGSPKSWRSWRSCCKSGRNPYHLLHWLVVSTPLKNISQLGWLFPIYGKQMFQTTNQYNFCNVIFFSICSYLLTSPRNVLSLHTILIFPLWSTIVLL